MGTFTAKKLHKGLAEYTITRYTHTHTTCIGVGMELPNYKYKEL